MAQSLKARLVTAESTIVDLKTAVKNAIAQRDFVNKQRDGLNKQLSDRNKDYKSLTDTYTTASKQVEKLESELNASVKNLSECTEFLRLEKITVTKQGSRLADYSRDARQSNIDLEEVRNRLSNMDQHYKNLQTDHTKLKDQELLASRLLGDAQDKLSSVSETNRNQQKTIKDVQDHNAKQAVLLQEDTDTIRDLQEKADKLEKTNIDGSTQLDTAKETIKGQEKTIDYVQGQVRRAEKDALACGKKLAAWGEAEKMILKQVDSLTATLKSVKAERLTLSRRNSGLKSNNASLSSRLVSATELVEQLQQELSTTQDNLRARDSDIKSRTSAFNDSAKSMQTDIDYGKQLADSAIQAYRLYRGAAQKKLGLAVVLSAGATSLIEAIVSGSLF